MNHNLASDMANVMESICPMAVVGFRFHPTDEELVNHFLKQKLRGYHDKYLTFAEINLCDFEPWDLPDMWTLGSDDQVWYFFCRTNYKFSKRNPKRKESKRSTKCGFWKSTGKLHTVKLRRGKKKIGTRRTLAFYKGNPKDCKLTKWTIYEYECIPDSNLPYQGNFVLCKLNKKQDVKTKKGKPNNPMASTPDLGNQNPNDTTAMSTCENVESSCHMASERENQKSDFEEGGCSGPMTATYDFDFDFDNLISISDFEGEPSPAVGMPSYLAYQSTYEKVESDYLMAAGFENQNLCNRTDISGSNKGESSAIMAKPADFGSQNHEKTDISTPKEDGLISLMNSLLEENVQDATFPEVDPQLLSQQLEELKAIIDLQNSLNSETRLPMCTYEISPFCGGLDTHASS